MLVQQQDVYFQTTVTFDTEDGPVHCRVDTFRVIATPHESESPLHFFDSTSWDHADKIFIATGTGTLPADLPHSTRCVKTGVAGEGTVAQIEWDQKGWRCAGPWYLTSTSRCSV